MRLMVIDQINLLFSVYPNEIGSFFKYVNKNYPLSIYPKQIFSFSINRNEVYSLSGIYQILKELKGLEWSKDSRGLKVWRVC